jgi:hypothetical protein
MSVQLIAYASVDVNICMTNATRKQIPTLVDLIGIHPSRHTHTFPTRIIATIEFAAELLSLQQAGRMQSAFSSRVPRQGENLPVTPPPS